MDKFDEVMKDIEKAKEVSNGSNIYGYKRIYPNTNEDLDKLFKNVKIKDKDVFSVLSSGDQVFTCFYNDAKSVDSFDINKLTIYYYYLRKWFITKKNKEYINDWYFDSNKDLIRLIMTVDITSEDEKNAQTFWLNYINKYNGIDKHLFLPTDKDYKNIYSDDIKGLSSKIKNMNFYNYDMSTSFILKKKYDVVVLSNILECLRHPAQLFRARSNVERLLKDDGICLCSHIMEDRNSKIHEAEVEIMASNNLEYIEDYNKYDAGYIYKKTK